MNKHSDHSLEHLLPRALPKNFPPFFRHLQSWRWTLHWTWMKLQHPNIPKDMFGRPFPLEHCLSEVGSGWATLVKACYDVVVRQGGTITQVKEKYGGLCFYAEGLDNAGDRLLWDIRDTSEHVCEECGEQGEPRQGGWVKTLCDKHADGRPAF